MAEFWPGRKTRPRTAAFPWLFSTTPSRSIWFTISHAVADSLKGKEVVTRSSEDVVALRDFIMWQSKKSSIPCLSRPTRVKYSQLTFEKPPKNKSGTHIGLEEKAIQTRGRGDILY